MVDPLINFQSTCNTLQHMQCSTCLRLSRAGCSCRRHHGAHSTTCCVMSSSHGVDAAVGPQAQNIEQQSVHVLLQHGGHQQQASSWQQQTQQPNQHQRGQRQQQPASSQHTLRHLINIHLSGHQQQQPSDTARLQRKLTAVLTDSTMSAADVADVLLVAERCGCLCDIHVAAALARLVRLGAAAAAAATAGDRAADAQSYGLGPEEEAGGAAAAGAAEVDGSGGGGGGGGDGYTLTAVVPLLGQQWHQAQKVKQTAAGLLAAAGPGSSRWHTPATAATAVAAAGLQRAAWAAAPGQDNDDDDEEEQLQQQHLLAQLAAAAEQQWPSMSAATITSCCWAFAHLQHEPSASLLQQAAASLAHMATSLRPAEQQQQPYQQQQQHLCASPRQVVLMLWALAKISSDPGSLEPTWLQQQQQLQVAADNIDNLHPAQGADGQGNSSSIAHTGSSTQSLLHHALSCLTSHLPDLSSQGLLLLLWAAATWTKNSNRSTGTAATSSSQLPAAAAAGLLSASGAAIEAPVALTPRGLSVLMWSAAHLGLTPDASWLAAWFAATHQALPAAGPQDLAVAAWGLARMGCPPPEDWLAALTHRAAATAAGSGPRELPALLWAFARLRYRPAAATMHALLQQGGRLASRGALSPQGLALLLWCCGVLGVQLPGRWLDGVLAAAAGFLPLFRPVEASALWVALVKLQHIPPTPWLDVWWSGSTALLPEAGGQQLVLLLRSAVRLGQAPPSHWMMSWLAAVEGVMSRGELTAQGYGIMWAALAQTAGATGQVPSEDWMQCYWSASRQPAVLAALDPLTAEKTLVGLAAVGAQLQTGLSLPHDWTCSFLAAALRVLPGTKLVGVANMLQAAGQLALPLPPVWLAAVMLHLQQLLVQAGLLTANTNSSSSSSIRGVHTWSDVSPDVPSGRSLVLSARLQRRWCEVCLVRVLYGLRAQQMLTPAAQRRLWYSAQPAAVAAMWGPTSAAAAAAAAGRAVSPITADVVQCVDSSSSSSSRSSSSDALEVWPWLSAAVYNVWPDRLSAQQALNTLER